MNILVYILLGGWAVTSLILLLRLWYFKDYNKINSYLFESIPTVFTTLGVLGTFLGIFNGLQGFDVNDIDGSIPVLLAGMKTAFLTSIIGIGASLVFGKASKFLMRFVDKKSDGNPNDELSQLNRIGNLIDNSIDQSKRHSDRLHLYLFDEEVGLSSKIKDLNDNSITTQKEIASIQENQHKELLSILEVNNSAIQKKFDKFSELLAKSNTEALVEVMQQATTEFNNQMKDLIDKLVKENFEELNRSVDRMNTWQVENKEMISALTDQFKQVSSDLTISSATLKEVASNTQSLTSENSHLSELIKELQAVMIDDAKFKQITDKLFESAELVKANTEAFDQTTDKLNNWVKNQMNFNDSVAKLLTRLEEIDKIKDINEVFWNDTKKNLNEGVSLIRKSSESLSNDLENINSEFYDRLNDTLNNLDTLIQRIIQNYNR